MKLYGLVGRGISHSYSPDFFKKKFAELGLDADYQLFDLKQVDELPELIESLPDLQGINITIPYKRMVSPILGVTDESVCYTGSVNTIKIERTQKGTVLKGFNTDIVGFEHALLPLIRGRNGIKALVLGTGGSSRAVAYVLRKYGIFFYSVTRNPQKIHQMAYHWMDSDVMNDFQLIINTTPLGMTPYIDACPDIPYHLLTRNHILFDLVYNPEETLFLKKGEMQGATTMGGRQMLVAQAEASWKIWKR
jgi:shikimate dehydrogenase